MRTLQLKINDKIYDKLLLLLSKFSKDEVEIITDYDVFTTTQNYLKEELEDIESRKAKFISQNELEQRLDSII